MTILYCQKCVRQFLKNCEIIMLKKINKFSIAPFVLNLGVGRRPWVLEEHSRPSAAVSSLGSIAEALATMLSATPVIADSGDRAGD